MKKILYGSLAILLCLGVTACSSSKEDKEDEKETVVEKEKVEDFTIEGEPQSSSDEFGMAFYITGVLRNNTDKEKSYVQITYNLYDKDGNLIGTALDNVNNLKAGGTWKFEAMGMDPEKVDHFELGEVTGF